ncbi:hypothetical protein ACLX1H_008267 [Fusarium chlamydosporum]
MDLSPEELGDWYIKLQEVGKVHNINIVTPEHVVPQVALSILHARDHGLTIPIVYNTSSFDSLASLQLMDGLVDIYLADFKVWKPSTSKRLLKADDYAATAKESIKAMHAQVGDLCFTGDGIAKKGLLIRHLVMPGKEDEGAEIMKFLAKEVSTDCFVNIMEQYHPDAHVGKPKRSKVDAKQENQEQLRNLDDNQGRRSLRKQLSLLKCKMSQAAEQEKAIFSRLGDLYVEIQSRETWAQSWTLSSPSIAPSCSSPDSSGFPAPTAPFVGSSADFVPMGYFNNFHHSAGPSYTQPEPEVYGLETVDEAAEDILCGPNSSCASIESEITPDTPFASALPFPKEKNDCGTDFGDELDDTRFLVARERRMSLPCLRHAWPEA